MNAAVLQPSLPFIPCPIAAAVDDLSIATGDKRGAIFTRLEVVNFILDLIGYTTDKPLQNFKLLEPSFGHGDFLLPAVERLLTAYRGNSFVADLSPAIRAVEIHRASVAATADKLRTLIIRFGHDRQEADQLIDHWLIQGDFLLADLPVGFTHAVGNPPYLRQESIAAPLLAEYRRHYSTIYDRADLYIPFFERGLMLLAERGTLGYICSDRWMKNKYGGPLRAMIASNFHMAAYVDMVDIPAFHSDVTAYPAITMITRDRPGPTRIGHCTSVDAHTLSDLACALRNDSAVDASSMAVTSTDIVCGSEPWMLSSSSQLALVRRLEAVFPKLEDDGCKVGIGVATGADEIFIGDFDDLDVEPERKLPLVTTRDIKNGAVLWHGLGVINPFEDDGSLVDLAHYPRFARYLQSRDEGVRKRNVALKNPQSWYRTIDRITQSLTTRPKLLIPDIKGEANIVFEGGRYYPHHNLYYIVSETWNLLALQALLRSGIAKLFVSAYSVKMRGGHLRFQAQYLRRIRVPRWRDIPESLRQALVTAAELGDKPLCDRLAFEVYGLNQAERDILSAE